MIWVDEFRLFYYWFFWQYWIKLIVYEYWDIEFSISEAIASIANADWNFIELKLAMIWLVIVFKSKLISRLISWNKEIVLAISLAISYICKSIEFDLNKRWMQLLDLQSWMILQALFSWKFKFSNAALIDSKPLASTTFLAFNEPRRLLSLKILLENSWKLFLFSITSLVSLKKISH